MNLKSLQNTSFTINNIPVWSCPSCNNGHLMLLAEQFHFEETKLSLSWRKDDDWEPDFINYLFHGTLRCKNCGDYITFLGTGSVNHDYFYDQISKEYEEAYIDTFKPLYFNPPLNLIQIHEKCPENIIDEIRDSFKLFWNDLPSCANKIRSSLELLMDHQNVNKTFLQGSKRRKMSLHNRIIKFKNKKPEIADYLLAIKWIGNTGSHVGELNETDIIDAYELLELSLNLLFDKNIEKLKKITKEINKRKGTRKK
jgi:hypothetical protein